MKKNVPIVGAPHFELLEQEGGETKVRKVHATDDPRVGQFKIPHALLADRALMAPLFSLMTPLEEWEHESGAGKEFICISALFEPIAALPGQKYDIPQYRIEFDHPSKPLVGREPEAKFIRVGKFEFRAIRQNVVRVPMLRMQVSALKH